MKRSLKYTKQPNRIDFGFLAILIGMMITSLIAIFTSFNLMSEPLRNIRHDPAARLVCIQLLHHGSDHVFRKRYGHEIYQADLFHFAWLPSLSIIIQIYGSFSGKWPSSAAG